MELAEHIISAFSRPPVWGDYTARPAGNPLELLETEYPDLRELVSDKSVLDFGCGYGYQAVTLAERYGAKVVGLDTNPAQIAAATKHGGDRVRFIEKLEPDETFDIIISQNAMEHFPYPVDVLSQMKRALKPSGKILVTFGPPWYSPKGSHMGFFCSIPWVNVLFPERAVMNVRSRYMRDGAKRYEEVESGLNKMSLAKFSKVVSESGLRVERLRYRCVKELNFLAKIPVIRELMCNHVTAILHR